jgi:hypothetical protein
MEQIVDALVLFVIVYATVRLATAWLKDFLTRKIRAEVDEFVERLETGKLIPVTVEVDHNQYFCYNALTKDFVCQGHTLLELAEKFSLRFPGAKLAIHNGDETAVRTLKEQLEKLYENRSSK